MKKTLNFVVRLIPAIIMMQTLYFKFTGAPESIYIFSKLGVEPFGRWGTGVAELMASILILLPKTQIYGSLLTAMIMLGAITSHLFVLGVVVQDDHGLLFSMALLTSLCSLTHLFLHRTELKSTYMSLRQKITSPE